MKQRDIPDFGGFTGKTTTAVPDAVFDHLLGLLTGAELKVLLYIIRRTKGFRKCTDTISLSQFQEGITCADGHKLDYGCGVHGRQTIIEALASLEEKNCIVIEKGNTQTSPIAYTIFFSYELVDFSHQDTSKENERAQGEEQATSKENVPDRLENLTSTSKKNVPPLVRKPYIQQTVLQQTVLQQTDSQQKGEEEAKNEAPISSSHGKNILPFKSPTQEKEERDPRSMTPAQQKRLDARAREQERETWWQEVERVLQTDFTATDRREAYHTRGLDKLQRDRIPLEKIIAALEAMDDFQVKNFTWENFAKWRPGLLSKKRTTNTNGHIPKDPHAGLVYWADRWMTETEADELGFNGGFNQYVMVPDDDVREGAVR